MTKEECMKLHNEAFDMVIRSQDEWSIIAKAVNVGIDSHLEALVKSTFDNTTGKVVIHPEEMHIFLRRLNNIWENDGDETAYFLRSDIIDVMENLHA